MGVGVTFKDEPSAPWDPGREDGPLCRHCGLRGGGEVGLGPFFQGWSLWACDVELEMPVLAAITLGYTRVMVPVSVDLLARGKGTNVLRATEDSTKRRTRGPRGSEPGGPIPNHTSIPF